MVRLTILLSFVVNCAFAQSFIKTQICHGIRYGVSFDVAPDGRFFVTQKGFNNAGALIKVFDANGIFLSVFYDLSDSVTYGGESGLLGITLDPDFTSNHYVYVYHTYGGDTAVTGDEHIIIERFTEVNNAGTQRTIIFDYLLPVQPFVHIGGNIHFRPSDSTHLYVTVGDFATGYTSNTPALLDNPLGKILRISKYPNAAPPADNPFYDDGDPLTGNCDWIWSYGHRNAFDFCFGPNDSLYATENGTQTYDEVNLITRGGFYGWPYCEGSADMDSLFVPCHAPGAIDPMLEFQGPPLPALTGIVFYTDTVWSQQQNHLITVDYNHANLIDITLGNSPSYNTVTDTSVWIDGSDLNGLTDIHQGSDGCLYVLQIGDSVFGGIYRFCPAIDSVFTWSMHAGPNPFSISTTIWYTVETASQVNISLYDGRGRLVETFENGYLNQGSYDIELDTRLSALSSGIYFCVMTAENFNSAIKLIVE